MRQTLFISAFCLLTFFYKDVGAQKNRPNILFIQCDQLNAKALSCYGGPIATPNIDRLVKNGVKFTQAICVTPSCTPSRGAMVTGKFPHQNGIVRNISSPGQEGIYEKDTTTDKLLNLAGYDTHHYGKWHLENGKERHMNLSYFPDPYTFERQMQDEIMPEYKKRQETDKGEWMNFYGFPFPVELSPYIKSLQPELDRKWAGKEFSDFAKKIGRLRSDISEWHDEICARKTVELIKSSKGKPNPFAVTCSFIWPHDPNFITNPYYSQFAPEDFKLPDNGFIEDYFKKNWGHEMVQTLRRDGVKEFLRIYFASVKYIDIKVGQMLKALEETGQLKNTMIIFTADHGDMLGNHSMIWKSTEAFYQEIVGVPLIISYPPKIKPGICGAQVNGTDIMPTILDYANVKKPSVITGKSLLPLLNRKEKETDFRKYNFCERIDANPQGKRIVLPGTKGSFMIKNDKIKYTIYPNGLAFCYDLVNDPKEFHNVVNNPKYSKQIKVLKKELANWLVTTGWTGRTLQYK